MLLAAGCQVRRQAAPVGVGLLAVAEVARATDRAALSPVAWARDGRQFAYGGRDGVWVHRLGDAVDAKIASGEAVTAVAWSQTANALASVDRGELWTMRPDGSARRRIDVSGFVSQPAWAPGGDRLAVVVQPPRAVGAQVAPSQIWWTSPDGATVRRVQWEAGGRIVALGWFPDALYLFAGVATSGTDAALEWWRVRIAYPDFVRLAHPRHQTLDPVLSPTGEWIGYVAAGGAGQQVFAIRPDGSGLHPVSHPVSRIAGLAWSPHGDKIAYGVMLDDTRAEVFVAASAAVPASGAPGRLLATYRLEYPDPAASLSLAWAPDEGHLAYGTNTGAFAGPVWVVRFGRR
jgi:Tol biopolymer transport system component